MSYEGYEQHICANGHYFSEEASFMFGGGQECKCPDCGAESAWYNGVDETNCEGVGYIPVKTLEEKFLVKAREVQICNLNCEHQISPAVFRIPRKEETKPLETYRKNDGVGSLYTLGKKKKKVGEMWPKKEKQTQ